MASLARLPLVLAGLAAALGSTGCSSLVPIQALASTAPLWEDGRRLSHLGEATGRACHSELFGFITLAADASIYTAKARAMADAEARFGVRPVMLVDVAIDREDVWYLVYTEHCTLVRARALGHARCPHPHSTQPSPPQSLPAPAPKPSAGEHMGEPPDSDDHLSQPVPGE